MAARTGDATLYVAEQAGRCARSATASSSPTPVLDLSDDVSQDGGEQGLLGLAFSPDGDAALRRLHRRRTATRRSTSSRCTGGVADTASRARTCSPSTSRSRTTTAGSSRSGPTATSTSGSATAAAPATQGPGHASGGNGQSLDTLLGKILRIDPTPSGDAPYTVPGRQPVRRHRRRPPGDLGVRAAQPVAVLVRPRHRRPLDRRRRPERVGGDRPAPRDRRPRRRASGVNFGWNRLEGTHEFRGNAPRRRGAAGLRVLARRRRVLGRPAAYVYRGTTIPALAGSYLFADYCDGTLRALASPGTARYGAERARPRGRRASSSFGQDNDGELYVLSQSRRHLQLVPR